MRFLQLQIALGKPKTWHVLQEEKIVGVKFKTNNNKYKKQKSKCKLKNENYILPKYVLACFPFFPLKVLFPSKVTQVPL